MLRRRRRDTKRTPRERGQTFNKMIPNIITVSAACAGLTAIRFAIDGKYEFAAVAITIAAVLDTLDGRMARLLNAATDFGAHLDSLSDFVAFGVAPGLVIYYWSLNDLGGFGFAIALFFAVCTSLRLARFNTRQSSLPPYAYNYFQGVPAPAGAGLVCLPMILSFELEFDFVGAPVLIGLWTVGVALLMVSHLPTYSFKTLKIPPGRGWPIMALVGLFLAGIAGRPWTTLSLLAFAYMATFWFSYRSYNRLKAEADRLTSGDDDDAGADGGDGEGGDDGSGGDDDAGDDRDRAPVRLRPV